MPDKPKLLKIVNDMQSKGLSEDEIRSNLREMGLSDDEVEKVMEIAEKDIYAKFKGEMSQFVEKRIKDNEDLIGDIVERKLGEEKEKIKEEVSSETEEELGDLAGKMNEKIDNLSLKTSKLRDENLEIKKRVEMLREDVDNLLGGPSKLRLAMAVLFLFAGLLLAAHSVFNVTPQVMTLDFRTMTEGIILLIIGSVYVLASVAFVTVGIHFVGSPTE